MEMKKLAALLFVVAFAVPALTACGSPCDKAFAKMEKCTLKEIPEKSRAKAKKSFAKMKDKFISECKKKEGKVKDCAKIDDCKKFDACMEKIK
jgi:hypothetical protein